jgi:hypothetical protein
VLVVGGRVRKTAELYDPVTGTWSAVAPMSIERGGPAIFIINGRVIVGGGYAEVPNVGSQPVSSSESYDRATNTWTAEPTSLSSARGWVGPSFVVSTSKGFSFGGGDPGPGTGSTGSDLYTP